MKNDKQQPENNDRFRDIDNHLQACMDKGIEAYNKGLTKYDNDHEPGSLSFDAWASGFQMAEKEFGKIKDQAPLSNKTKVVESVEQVAKIKHDEYEQSQRSYESWVKNGMPMGKYAQGKIKYIDGFKDGFDHASQFKNTDAVKVITDRIAELETEIEQMGLDAMHYNMIIKSIEEFNNVLKLIQP